MEKVFESRKIKIYKRHDNTIGLRTPSDNFTSCPGMGTHQGIAITELLTEIQQLSEAYEELIQANLDRCFGINNCSKYKTLQAENRKLREALENISNMKWTG